MSVENIVKFKNLLTEDKKAKEHNKTIKSDNTYWYFSLKNTIDFRLCYRKNYHTITFGNHYSPLITLDEEDKQYFINKYVTPKVIEYERLQKELNDLNKE